jgi:cytochrome P450
MKNDLLSILMTDELVCNDDILIVDECFTFFFAGSQTSSITTQNLIMHLIKNPSYGDKIIRELEEKIVRPFVGPSA